MASRSLGTLTLDLVVKLGGLSSGMSQAERIAKDRTARLERTFRGLRNTIAGAFAAIGGTALIGSIIRNTAEAEKAFALLTNAVEQNGGAVGRTAQQLSDMAGELQKVTTFGDDAIMTAQQLLLRFQSIQGQNFDRALQSTLDLATALGTDLSSAAQLVGKALEAPEKGVTQLQRSGVVLEKSQQDLIKRLVETGRVADAQRVLLDGLEKRYDGAARAARDTFGGAIEGVKNAFGDLLEVKGGLPEAIDRLNDLADLFGDPEFIQNINTVTSGIVTGFTAAAKAIAETGRFFRYVGESIASAVSGPAFDDLIRTSEKIAELQKRIERIQNSKRPDLLDFGGNAAKDKTIAVLTEELRVLEAQYESASKAATRLTVSAGGRRGGGPAGPNAPVEPVELEEIVAAGQKISASPMEEYYQRLDDLTRSSTERQIAQLTEVELALQELFDTGRITAEQFNERWSEAFGEVIHEVEVTAKKIGQETGKEISEFAIQAARNMQDAFAQFLFDPFQDGLKGMLKGFIDVIRQMVAQVAAAKIFDGINVSGGGVGGFLGNLLGFADGGRPAVGMPAIVGERGPEIFIPDVAGRVVPNHKLGGMTVAPVYNIDARGATQDVIRMLPAILAESERRTVQAARAAVMDDFSRRPR